MTGRQARIEIGAPRVFTGGAIVATYLYGFLVAVPILIAFLVMSVMGLNIWTVGLLLLSAVPSLTLRLANSLVTRLVNSLGFEPCEASEPCVMQLTLSPRLRSGMRALVEDADDVGRVDLSETELIYQGDSIQLRLPFDKIRTVEVENAGFRGLFAQWRIEIEPIGLAEVQTIHLAERSAWLAANSRKITSKFFLKLQEGVKRARFGPE